MKRISMMVHCSIRSITIRRGKSTKAMKKAKKTRVIPGYHLTFGIVITLLSLIVLIPLASVLVYALKLSPGEWFRLIMKENVRNAFLTSVGCSFLAAVINTVFGLILAWTLVKYEFPGKKLLDGFIELPFALPTAVAGIMLGASRRKTFLAVILPELRPALLTGFGLAFARGIGEYGSVIYISGNSAKDKTQVISYVIMQKLGMIDYESATAIALLMLIISFVLLLFINIVQARQSARTNLL